MSALWNGLQDTLGGVLAFFYDLIPNLGVAIILLTLVVSLLLFPLTLKQTRSMRAMSAIQPEVKALQAKLKGDRETLNQELMALYKERGVNPAAGCLPILLQMPLWFALFRVLQTPEAHISGSSSLAAAIGRNNVDFLGMDLKISPSTALAASFGRALPYLVLILIVVATGYYQQYQTTVRTRRSGQAQPPQAQQMQTIMKIFPLIFGFISWQMPGGLVLYFATSQIFRIGQQAMILSIDGDPFGGDDKEKQPSVEAEGSVDGGSDGSKSGPSSGERRKRRKKKGK